MRVLLRVPRVMQDAGRVRPLICGAVYDVPEVLAQQWIRTGKAETADVPLEAAAATPACRAPIAVAAIPRVPENKVRPRGRR